jgi:hypothetical protein
VKGSGQSPFSMSTSSIGRLNSPGETVTLLRRDGLVPARFPDPTHLVAGQSMAGRTKSRPNRVVRTSNQIWWHADRFGMFAARRPTKRPAPPRSINGIPVFDSTGNFTGYRGTGRDVTAEVEAALNALIDPQS